MNFLGVGPFELLLILVIATVVLGPERMARAGRILGRLYSQYRLRWQKDVDEMTRELRRELDMLQQEMDQIRQATEAEIKAAQVELKAAEAEILATQSMVKQVVEEEPKLPKDEERAGAPEATSASMPSNESAQSSSETEGLPPTEVEPVETEKDEVET